MNVDIVTIRKTIEVWEKLPNTTVAVCYPELAEAAPVVVKELERLIEKAQEVKHDEQR